MIGYGLAGLARHAACGLLILPRQVGQVDDPPAYQCRVCPHQPVIPADRAHHNTRQAVAGFAPQLAWTLPLDRLTDVLTCVKLNDDARVTGMRWQPSPGLRSRAARNG
jgi:hypothetical protein